MASHRTKLIWHRLRRELCESVVDPPRVCRDNCLKIRNPLWEEAVHARYIDTYPSSKLEQDHATVARLMLEVVDPEGDGTWPARMAPKATRQHRIWRNTVRWLPYHLVNSADLEVVEKVLTLSLIHI